MKNKYKLFRKSILRKTIEFININHELQQFKNLGMTLFTQRKKPTQVVSKWKMMSMNIISA